MGLPDLTPNGPKVYKWGMRLSALLAAALAAAPAARALPAPDQIRELKRSIVNIEANVSIGLSGDESGNWLGTGFVVDAANGLVVTNRHVASRSPAAYKIHFLDGTSTNKVTLAYVDPWQDFAFLKVSTDGLKGALKAVKLGDSFALRPQDPVFLIGNNEAQEYTVLYGEVMNTEVTAGDRHSGDFQVSYRNRGGSSGSPVFDGQGTVVGLHYKGTDVTGFEIRVEYVKDALAQLGSGGCAPRRGETGCVMGLMPISDAEKNYHLPPDIAERLRSAPDKVKKMIYVHGVIPGEAAAGRLEPGDLVLDIDGTPVGSDLYKADKLVDARVGSATRLHVVRNGAELTVAVPVADAQAGKVRSFAQFSGGVVHDLTPELKRAYHIDTPGVFLSQADEGTSFSSLGVPQKGSPKNRIVEIQAVNGRRTPDLASFIRATAGLKDGDEINVTVRDFALNDTGAQAVPVTVELKFHPLKVFNWSDAARQWVETAPPSGVN